jgi:hypothetical protein
MTSYTSEIMLIGSAIAFGLGVAYIIIAQPTAAKKARHKKGKASFSL